ncbi:MAG: zinc-binding dehydrogenase [Gemmatimonadota bacterium]
MRAMVLPRWGGPELFEEREVERPEPGPGEVGIRVVASGTNPVEAKVRKDGYRAGVEPPIVLGYDGAGVVERVGPGVEELAEGDEVWFTPPVGSPHGTYAEYTVVRADIVARRPDALSFVEAAAVPLAGGTAWEAVVRRLGVRVGETVLIHGAAGGVGSFAVQYAKAAGARVLASASPKNHDLLRELGADVAIDYRTQDAAEVALEQTDGRGADAVFEVEGEELVARVLAGVRPFGRIACILPPSGDLTALYRKNVTLHGVMLTRERRRLDEMRPLFERGQARPVVDEVLPLDEVAEAHRRLDTRHGRGKVVLEVGG